MPVETNLEFLVGRQESSSTIIRFEDATDQHAPRLSYSVPLPGAFEGSFYIEVDFGELPWTSAAFTDQRKTRSVLSFNETLTSNASAEPPPLDLIAGVPPLRGPLRAGATRRGMGTTVGANVSAPSAGNEGSREPAAGGLAALRDQALLSSDGEWVVRFEGVEVPFSEVVENARRNRALVFHRTFGGTIVPKFVAEAPGPEAANPRFVIKQTLRLSSFFENYGAGRTLSVFSLMPGEETKLYIRTWRRTEDKTKEASSIFDSFTEEAANEFETDLQSEVTDKESHEKTTDWHLKGSHTGSVNMGVAKASHTIEGGISKSSKSLHESMAKSVSKVASHHASKASSRRDINVSTEIEASEAAEFETITERVIKNTNLSRTLNIVTRELNQEFSTYLSLIDVKVAFVNDLGVYDEYEIYDLDRMLLKYLPPPPTGGGGLATGPSPFSQVKAILTQQIRTVFDFEGTQHDFLEEAADINNRTYLRVRRSRHPDQPNPFYPPGAMPVEGVVLETNRYTVRTAAAIIDALLGHGVALDNYALGRQQEALRKEQLENRKLELALALIEAGDTDRLEAFRSLFGSADTALLRAVALGEEAGP